MYTLNVVCIIFGVAGFACMIACAIVGMVSANRRAREAKRRYVKD